LFLASALVCSASLFAKRFVTAGGAMDTGQSQNWGSTVFLGYGGFTQQVPAVRPRQSDRSDAWSNWKPGGKRDGIGALAAMLEPRKIAVARPHADSESTCSVTSSIMSYFTDLESNEANEAAEAVDVMEPMKIPAIGSLMCEVKKVAGCDALPMVQLSSNLTDSSQLEEEPRAELLLSTATSVAPEAMLKRLEKRDGQYWCAAVVEKPVRLRPQRRRQQRKQQTSQAEQLHIPVAEACGVNQLGVESRVAHSPKEQGVCAACSHSTLGHAKFCTFCGSVV